MKKVNSPTKKSLYELVRREIDASKQRNANGYALPRETTDMYGFNANQEDNTKTLGDIKKILESTVPPQILQGLEVYATDPASNFVIVNPGIGTIGGTKLYLEYAMTLEIPLELNVDVFYINMANGYLTVDAATFDNKLVLAKVVKQQPQTTFITDIKDSIGSAYIVNYKTLSLKVDKNNKFEEDSLEILRDNIGPVLADNIIGNIRLSEDLKITNTQGTLELNSDSVKILDEDGDIRAKFNRNGTYFYDEDGIETAKFTKDSAHIGNILVTKDSIGSSNFASGTSGFKINDSGYAEFEDVKIRGVLSATTFEKDTISAVGGSVLIGNASNLLNDITAGQSVIEFNEASFGINEVLTIKNGFDKQEYLLVTDNLGGGTYAVQRGYGTGCCYDWNSGVAVVSTGTTNTGYLLLTATENNSPYIDVVTRNSFTCYDDVTTKVRLGNLEGITDPLYGTLCGYGLYADNVYLKGKMYAPDIKTSICGSRVELGPNGLLGYNDLEYNTFALDTGSNFRVGNSNSNSYLCYCNATESMCLRGNIYSNSLTLDSCCDGARLSINTNGLTAYDINNCATFSISCGHVVACDIFLYHPTCACRYSFLSAGELRFHDDLGEVPYAKRMCSGVACTGDTIVLNGWTTAPKIVLGVSQLQSYNSSCSGACQSWNVYYDNLTCYCTSPTCYGYCFDTHATLQTSASWTPACIVDSSFGTCYLSQPNTNAICVRNRFQLWCNAACGNYYYGTLYYDICYRLNGATTWCKCCFSYQQAHASLSEIQSTETKYDCIAMPSAGCWQYMSCQSSLIWTDSGINSSGYNIGTCCYSGGGCLLSATAAVTGNLTVCSVTNAACFIFSPPTGAYCTCFYWCYNTASSNYQSYCDNYNYCFLACTVFVSQYSFTCMYAHISDTINLPLIVSYKSECGRWYDGNNGRLVCGYYYCTRMGASGFNGCVFNVILEDYPGLSHGGPFIYSCATLTDCNHICTSVGNGACAYKTLTGWSGNNGYGYSGVKNSFTVNTCACVQHSSSSLNSVAWACLVNICVDDVCAVYCYCIQTGSAACCNYQNVYTTQSKLATSCILDPNGCVNWLAIAYS